MISRCWAYISCNETMTKKSQLEKILLTIHYFNSPWNLSLGDTNLEPADAKVSDVYSISVHDLVH